MAPPSQQRGYIRTDQLLSFWPRRVMAGAKQNSQFQFQYGPAIAGEWRGHNRTCNFNSSIAPQNVFLSPLPCCLRGQNRTRVSNNPYYTYYPTLQGPYTPASRNLSKCGGKMKFQMDSIMSPRNISATYRPAFFWRGYNRTHLANSLYPHIQTNYGMRGYRGPIGWGYTYTILYLILQFYFGPSNNNGGVINTPFEGL